MSKKTAFAIACHPDDVDFMMAGTLIKLKEVGYEVHYMDIANGSLGTHQYTYEQIVRMRRQEAMDSAAAMGAIFHESICDDLEVFYNLYLLNKLIPVVREVAPDIILTHGPYDYMEDHTQAGRLAVAAAFCRGMINAKCAPTAQPMNKPVTVYHSMPHSITDMLRRPVVPGIFVNIASTIELKKKMLSCHRSQKEWLDVSQGSDAYLKEMVEKGEYFGKMSKRYTHAEGWIRHNHLGFCEPSADPLVAALGDDAFVNTEFEDSIRMEF